MKEYVAGFLFSDDWSEVLLIEKNRPEWQKGRLNGIGGKVESNETPHEAMCREFEEETGMVVDDWTYFCCLEGKDWVVHFWHQGGDLTKARSVTDEQVHIIPVKDLPAYNCMLNLHWLIPMAKYSGLHRVIEG